MGNGHSKYDYRRHRHPGPAGFYPAPGSTYSTAGRRTKTGHRPSVLPPREDEYDDYDYDPDYRHRSHRARPRVPFPEPETEYPPDSYPYDGAGGYPYSQPPNIPFAPVQPTYTSPPVIPNHRRGHSYPHSAPRMQMPIPNTVIPQGPPPMQSQFQPQPAVIPPQPPVVIPPAPQLTTAQGVHIPYPDANAPIIPPGQAVIFPANTVVPSVAPSSSVPPMEPAMQMPEPHGPSSAGFGDRSAPGRYAPSEADDRPRRSPEHRRTRSHTYQGRDYYDRPRHRHSVDSGHYYRRRREDSPLRNPLPSPPKDLFERPDLADLLSTLRMAPEDSTLKRDPNAAIHTLIIPHDGPARVERIVSRPPQQTHVHAVHHPSLRMRDRGMGEKKKSGGLFRTLSNKLKGKHHDPRHYQRDERLSPVQEILTDQPIVITAEEQVVRPHMYPPPVEPIISPPPIADSEGGQSSAPVIPPPGQFGPPGSTPAGMPMPLRMPSPAPSSSRAPPPSSPSRHRPPPLSLTHVKIDQTNAFADLLHFAPHPVHYMNKVYPTAYHLYEASKFMDHRLDIAESIRTCGGGSEGIARAGSISRDCQEHIRPDWQTVMVDVMENALYQKFIQHELARRLLLSTGDQNLLFSESGDGFWGDGPTGQGFNEIGKALMRIRARLQEAGYT